MVTSYDNLHIAVAGSPGVGKSSLTYQFIQNVFTDETDPTVMDSYKKHARIDDKSNWLEILDWVNFEEGHYFENPYDYLKNQLGYLLVFSVTDRYSFEEVNDLVERILKMKDKDSFPMILIGNKCDLEMERVVSIDEAKNYSKDIGIPYIETSAKTRSNVDESFHQLVRQVRKYHNLEDELTTTEATVKKVGCTIN
jgi:GTPase KRas protein